MERRILKELESEDGEVRVFVFALIIISVIVIFFGTVFIVGSNKSNNSIEKNEEKIVNKSKIIGDKIYKITSNNADIDGVVEVNVDKKDGSVDANYFLHITENLPVNKVCFENEEDSDDKCRWIDFYNYVVSIRDGNDKEISGRLYPMFCSSFSDLTKSKTLYDSYNSCWQEKKGYQYTDKYFIKINASYETLDNFLSHKFIDIYDAKDYTKRANVTKDKMTTITENVDDKNAVKNGSKIKTYKFKYEL